MTNALSDHAQISVVSNFSELINADFQGDQNAICWHRSLLGDFKELLRKHFNPDIMAKYPNMFLGF